MSLFSRLKGIVGSFFQLGGPLGPGLNANGAALEAKNQTNTAFAVMRGADPVAANDFVTLEYLQAGGTPSTTQMLYVNKGGSDVTGNGSIVSPFLTIAHAITVVNGFADASTAKRYNINVGPGDWADAILLPSWTWIVGSGELETNLNGTLDLDPATWSPNVDQRGGFTNANLTKTLFGGLTFDFNAVGSPQGKIYFQNCLIQGHVTFQAYFGVGAAGLNAYDFNNCQLLGHPFAITQTGMSGTLTATNVVSGGSIFVNSQNDGSNNRTSFTALGGGMNKTLDAGGITATWTTAAPGPNDIAILLSGFGVSGPLSLSGTGIVYKATADGIPASVTLLASASAPIPLSAYPIGTALIWQPNGPGGGPSNVFTTWAALYAATKPGAKILVDFTFNANPTIPAGAWSNIYEIAGYFPSTEPFFNAGVESLVNLAEGAVFSTLSIVSDGVTLNSLATATVPIVRGDTTTFLCRNGGSVQTSSALPIIRFTPGNSGANFPFDGPVFLGLDAYPIAIGGAENGGDIEVNPTVASSNFVGIFLRNSGIVNGSVVSGGVNAATSNLYVQFLDNESVYDSVGFTAPTIGTLSISSAGAGLRWWQFGAATSGTSVGALTAWIPIGNNASLIATPGLPDGAVSGEQGLVINFSIELLQSGAGPANPTTFALYKANSGGAPVAVPGASVTFDTAGISFAGGGATFVDWHTAGDYYFFKVTTANPLPAPFTQITAVLQ